MSARLRSGKARKKSPSESSPQNVDKSDKQIEGDITSLLDKRSSSLTSVPSSEDITESNLDGEYLNISLLLLLYVLQGIPLGMAGSIPMMLQNKNISYKQQAMFSFVYWPFSMKLLWAPLVDALFVRKFGRRKSWIIPTQYMLAVVMFTLSFKIDSILNVNEPDVFYLTVMFFTLNFLAATQDVAVDGWALTLLQKRNVAYSSTCNTVGQTAGYFIGKVILLAFSSAEFCNKYLRTTSQDVGIITLSGFLFFWAFVFLVTTTLITLFKHEKDSMGHDGHGIFQTYLMLIKLSKLEAVRELVGVVITVKVSFAATDGVTALKLIEAGLKKESLALLAVPLVPLQILLPFFISRFSSGKRPLDLYIRAFPYRLLMGIVFAGVVHWTSIMKDSFTYTYYATILAIYALHQVTLYSMFVSMMAFYAKVCDPAIGGTYMTMLTTLGNLGGKLPTTLALWLVDSLTVKLCATDVVVVDERLIDNACRNAEEIKTCADSGGNCLTTIDGFYVETTVCVLFGCLWLLWKRHSIRRLQNYKESAWKMR